MKINGIYRLVLCLLVVAGAALFLGAQDRERRSPKPKTAEQEMRTVITRWADAVKRRDVATLDRMFSDGLFITDFAGATRGKKEELEILKPSATTRTVSVTNDNIVIRTYPKSNTAIVTAVVKMVFRTNGRDSSMAMRYTSVWEKRGGRWQLAVLQTTRLAAK